MPARRAIRGLLAVVLDLVAAGTGCGAAAGTAVPPPCRLLGEGAASRIQGYQPDVLSNGVLRYLKLQGDGRVCAYGPAPMQGAEAGSWQLSLMVTREPLPGGPVRAPSERRLVLSGTPVVWQWASSDQSGTMSFSRKGISYLVSVAKRGGTASQAEGLTR